MYQLFDSLFDQYSQYETHDIFLEMFAVLFGLISVWYSKRNNILVFPTGMISTAIFVYILFKCSLLGDMIINGYFFIMSIYGWYVWSRKKNEAFTCLGRLSWGRVTGHREPFTAMALHKKPLRVRMGRLYFLGFKRVLMFLTGSLSIWGVFQSCFLS